MKDADLHRREWIAERAAIREYDGGMTRQQAEVMARWEWEQRERGRPQPAPDPREAPGKC